MKRVLTILAILILPLSVWAMTPISDSALSDVTGQAGVNISLDLKMDLNIGTVAWGDADGLQTTFNPWPEVTDGGYVGINNLNITNLWLRARIETWDSWNYYSILFLKPLTIDVATGEKEGVAGITFVRIGIGAMQVSMDALSLDVALGARVATSNGTDGLTSAGLDQVMGVASLGAMSVYMNPWSYIDIYAHVDGSMGVNLDMNLTIDRITLGYVSWGDTDGLAAGDSTTPLLEDGTPDVANTKFWMLPNGTALGDVNTAGYVGLRDLNLGDLTTPAVTINGVVAIDVNTSNWGTYCVLNALGAKTGSRPSDGTGIPLPNGMLADPHITEAEAIALGYDPATAGISAGQYAALLTIQGLTGLATTGFGDGLGGLTAQEIIGFYLTETNAPTIIGGGPSVYNYLPISVVHISFPTDFVAKVAKITANVVVSNSANLAGASLAPAYPLYPYAGILGDIYIQGLAATVKLDSWVDIWAH